MLRCGGHEEDRVNCAQVATYWTGDSARSQFPLFRASGWTEVFRRCNYAPHDALHMSDLARARRKAEARDLDERLVQHPNLPCVRVCRDSSA